MLPGCLAACRWTHWKESSTQGVAGSAWTEARQRSSSMPAFAPSGRMNTPSRGLEPPNCPEAARAASPEWVSHLATARPVATRPANAGRPATAAETSSKEKRASSWRASAESGAPRTGKNENASLRGMQCNAIHFSTILNKSTCCESKRGGTPCSQAGAWERGAARMGSTGGGGRGLLTLCRLL